MATKSGKNAGFTRASAVRGLFLVVVCLECCVNGVWGTTSAPPTPATISAPNCSAVAHLFELRRINPADIPREPKHEMLLKYCEIPETGTCCTYEIENRLATSSKLQLERTTKDSIGKLSSVLATRAHKFNEFFKELLSDSKREFDLMFKRTYGVIYEQNSYVFADLFTELENYYARGKVDLSEAMDSFFNVLYQKMFTVLNSQYKFDDKYLGCVSEHMKELKPFGDVPDKLSVQVKRSFVATRTYAQALSTAADVAKNMVNVRPNADCTAALMKMQQCNLCKGHPEKPCANYCVNVMKGCLQYYHDLDIEWDNFVSSMEKVSERLLGPFNIVMVVEPINIKISEAIMNFQETGQGISTQVFQGCGRPVLSLRKRSINPKFVEPNNVKQSNSFSDIVDDVEPGILDIDADIDEAELLSDRVRRSTDLSSQELHYDQVEFPSSDEQAGQPQRGRKKNKKNQQGKKNNNNNNNNNNNDDEDYNKEPHLDKLVKDIRQKVKDSKKFWSNLPYQICNNEELAAPPSPDANCWNGSTVDRYSHAIANDHTLNPEFPSSQSASSTRQSSILANQIFSLRTVVSNLRNAYNGYDVEWSDQEEPYYGSGSGSGGGIDDEDDVSSGLGSIEESIVHSRGEAGREHGHHDPTRSHPSSGTTRSETIYPKHNVPTTHSAGGTITHSDHKPKESGGSSSRVTNVMSLRRALITYLFPIYMAWFGGIISDLL